jgi:hypothetical protein
MNWKILPYVQVNGSYTLPDDAMTAIWDLAEKEGITQQVFYDGVIHDHKTWLALCKSPRNNMHTIWCDEKIAEVGWLNDIDRNSASAHYFMFRWTWGKHTKEIGHMMLDYWFNFKSGDRFLFDTIIGKTPSDLRTATIFLRKAGMTVLGEIPHIAYNAYKKQTTGIVISYMTREGFYHG